MPALLKKVFDNGGGIVDNGFSLCYIQSVNNNRICKLYDCEFRQCNMNHECIQLGESSGLDLSLGQIIMVSYDCNVIDIVSLSSNEKMKKSNIAEILEMIKC